jgi:hypothetical protein
VTVRAVGEPEGSQQDQLLEFAEVDRVRHYIYK